MEGLQLRHRSRSQCMPKEPCSGVPSEQRYRSGGPASSGAGSPAQGVRTGTNEVGLSAGSPAQAADVRHAGPGAGSPARMAGVRVGVGLSAGSPAQVPEDVEGDDGSYELDDEYQAPRKTAEPGAASAAERVEHEMLGRSQYRSWCRHCVAARGVGQQHRCVAEDPRQAEIAEVVVAYMFLGDEKEVQPHIVVKDRKSEAYNATSLDSKTSSYAIAFVAGAIQEMGYKRILFKSDNEPSILKLKEQVSQSLPG